MPAYPTLSVVVPVYNAGRLASEFQQCIDSIIGQQYPHWELILVDDASTDDTAAILDRCAAGERRIRIHRHTENRRQGEARNTGTRLASGDYILYCDYDDCLYPQALATVAAIAQSRGRPDIIQLKHKYFDRRHFHPGMLVPDKSRLWWKSQLREWQSDDILERFLNRRISVTSWSRAIRASLAKQVEFPAMLPEDIPHSLNLCARARTLVETLEPCYAHIARRGSDGESCGKRNLLNDYISCFSEVIGPRLKQLNTGARMPQAHSVFCSWWVQSCALWLDGFDHSDEDLRAFGRMVDSAGLVRQSAGPLYSLRSLNPRKLGVNIHRYLLARDYYRDYRGRLRTGSDA